MCISVYHLSGEITIALAAAVGGFILAALFPQVLPVVTFFIPAFVVWYMSGICVKRFRKFDGSEGNETAEIAPLNL